MQNKTERERIEVLEEAIKKIPSEERIAEIVRDTMMEVVKEAGKFTKAGMMTVATIIVSIGIITGGFKWVLGLLGFQYVMK